MHIKLRNTYITILLTFLLIAGSAIMNPLCTYAITYKEIVSEVSFSRSMVNYNDTVTVNLKTSFSGTLQPNATLYLEGYNGSTYTQIQVSLQKQSNGVYSGVANTRIGNVGYEFTPSWLEINDTSGTQYMDYTLKNRFPNAKFKVYRDWESEITENVSVAPGGKSSIYDVSLAGVPYFAFDESDPIATIHIDDNSIADAYSGGWGFGSDECFVSLIIQGVSQGTTKITVTDNTTGNVVKIFKVTVTAPATSSQTICVGGTVTVPVEYNSDSLIFNFGGQNVSYENGITNIQYNYYPDSSPVYSINSNFLTYNKGTFSVKVNSVGSYYLNLYDNSMNRIKTVELTVKNHEYNEGNVIQPKTCSQHEIIEYTCVSCGKKEQREGSEYGDHQWNTEYTVDIQPTCTEKGLKSKHCKICNAKKPDSSVDIDMIDHEYGDWEVTKYVTCTTDGSRRKQCKNCGDEITETMHATGHSFSTEYEVDQAATCTKDGLKSKHCQNCEETTETTVIPALGHDWDEGNITTEPTCTETGVKTFTCNRCGQTRTESVDAVGHKFSDKFKTDQEPSCTGVGSKSRHCMNCDETIDVTEIPATGHTFGKWVEITPSTCENEGLRQRTCEVCGIVESENLDPNGHEWKDNYTVDLAATCTQDGSQSIHCKNCDAVIDSQVIPAKGHKYGDWIVLKEPECELFGLREKTCSVCGDVIREDIPGLGHAWNENPTIDKPATCTEDGSQSIHCPRCNSSRDITVIPAVGHKWNTAYTVDVPATESSVGSQSIHCIVCGTIKEGSAQTIAKLSPAEIVDLPSVKISKPAAAKKAVTVKWKKVTKKNLKKIKGIEIQVANDPGFTDIVKVATAGKKKTSKKIKGLTSKQTYYVRIRAYKNAADGKHVSAWKTKKVKIK